MQKSESAKGQFQKWPFTLKLAICLFWPFVGPESGSGSTYVILLPSSSLSLHAAFPKCKKFRLTKNKNKVIFCRLFFTSNSCSFVFITGDKRHRQCLLFLFLIDSSRKRASWNESNLVHQLGTPTKRGCQVNRGLFT